MTLKLNTSLLLTCRWSMLGRVTILAAQEAGKCSISHLEIRGSVWGEEMEQKLENSNVV